MNSKFVASCVAAIALMGLTGCATNNSNDQSGDGSGQSVAQACQIINSNSDSIDEVTVDAIENIDKDVTNTEVKDAFKDLKDIMIKSAQNPEEQVDMDQFEQAIGKFNSVCSSDDLTPEVNENPQSEQSGDVFIEDSETVVTE